MSILMCPPDQFAIAYEINPWMDLAVDVDPTTARAQWDALRSLYESLGEDIEVATPVKGLPDMVYTANAGLLRGGRAILSNFRHPERQGEQRHWRAILGSLGFDVQGIPDGIAFEGAGDALYLDDTLFCGYPFRTEFRACAVVGAMLGEDIVPLELVDPRFYHLDTCFAPLGPGTALLAPSALSPSSVRRVRERTARTIEVSLETAADFACNAVAIGDRVISSSSSLTLRRSLERAGLELVTLPMDEFIKGGGGVRCLTLQLGNRNASIVGVAGAVAKSSSGPFRGSAA